MRWSVSISFLVNHILYICEREWSQFHTCPSNSTAFTTTYAYALTKIQTFMQPHTNTQVSMQARTHKHAVTLTFHKSHTNMADRHTTTQTYRIIRVRFGVGGVETVNDLLQVLTHPLQLGIQTLGQLIAEQHSK